MSTNEELARPDLYLVPTGEPGDSDLTYTINISTLAIDGNEAHFLARAILERIADLPGLLRTSTTVSFEEPVNRVLIK